VYFVDQIHLVAADGRGIARAVEDVAHVVDTGIRCGVELDQIDKAPGVDRGAGTAIDAGRFVDLVELDAASNTGVDNMRDILDSARYAPTVGRYKVYLIDEVHMLSKGAFNSM